MPTRVFNLRTGEYEAEYSCSPREAVIAAHAQSRGDFSTWLYSKRYQATEAKHSWNCGDFAAMKGTNEANHD